MFFHPASTKGPFSYLVFLSQLAKKIANGEGKLPVVEWIDNGRFDALRIHKTEVTIDQLAEAYQGCLSKLEETLHDLTEGMTCKDILEEMKKEEDVQEDKPNFSAIPDHHQDLLDQLHLKGKIGLILNSFSISHFISFFSFLLSSFFCHSLLSLLVFFYLSNACRRQRMEERWNHKVSQQM